MDLELVCRICLEQPKNESLMATNDEFYTQIELCTGLRLQLMHASKTATKICTSCALLLRAALKLRTICEQADKRLRSEFLLLEKEPDLKEVVEEASSAFGENEEDDDEDICASEIHLDYLNTDDEGSQEQLTISIKSDSDTNDAETAAEGKLNGLKNNKSPVKDTTNKYLKIKRISIAVQNAALEAKSPDLLGVSYVCKFCSNVYSDKVKLTAHMKLHSEYKPHECEICQKRFRQTPQLARHMNSHTGQRPYKCKFCSSRFADPSTHKKHERIHTNERPYKCEYCSKSFAYSNVLNVHLMVHTGERPFSCQFCDRRFSQLHHKKAHERVHERNAKGL
ncbi:transcription factor Ouib [Scaptodrosophila lebanonensis]|uniref:Transcription factor Ouib n=1 Tax=Drosophila lebanonensis TaxID=7225 RepID=A0A6J2TGZ1_DROLE|nr:transcription factor Ouib [Scaptodrosophila lebanonensis]